MSRRKRLTAILVAGGMVVLGVWYAEFLYQKRHEIPEQARGGHVELSPFGDRPCAALIDVRTEPVESMIEPYHGFDADFVTDLPQSFAGYSLAVGDVDNDGDNELVLGTTPDSRLYIARYDPERKRFRTELLEEKLAGFGCSGDNLEVAGGVSGLLVTDMDGDGANEIVAMTDQLLRDSNVRLWILSKGGEGWRRSSAEVKSDSCDVYRTRGLAAVGTDDDGVKEVFSVHAGGALFRHKVSGDFEKPSCSLERTLSGSGKSLEIADLSSNGSKVLVVAEAGRGATASVRVYGFSNGDIDQEPVRLLPTGEEKEFWDATTCAGDLDNDGRNELVVAWTRTSGDRSVVDLDLYEFDPAGDLVEQRNMVEDTTLFGGAGELRRRMCIGRIGDAEDNRLYISSSRGDEYRTVEKFSERWGLYELALSGPEVELRKIANFRRMYITAANICIGDVDNDGNDELVVGTGKGPLTRHGSRGYVFVVDR